MAFPCQGHPGPLGTKPDKGKLVMFLLRVDTMGIANRSLSDAIPERSKSVEFLERSRDWGVCSEVQLRYFSDIFFFLSWFLRVYEQPHKSTAKSQLTQNIEQNENPTQDLHSAGQLLLVMQGTEGNIYRGNTQDGEKQSQAEIDELLLKVTAIA